MAEDDKSEDRPGGFEPPPGAPPPAWKPTPPPSWQPPPPPTFRPPDIQPPQPPPGVSAGDTAASDQPPPAPAPQTPAPYAPPPGAPPPTYGGPPMQNPYGPQYGGGPQYPYPGYPPQPYVVRKTNGFAIASLILGVIWMYWVGSILALIFGYIGKNQIDNSNNTQDGRGLAIAGIVLGWIGIAVLAIVIVVAIAAD